MTTKDSNRRPLLTDRARKRCEPLAGAMIVLFLGATAGGLVLVSASSRGTQGARASTRLKWEERRIEIEAAAAKAGLDPKE